MAIIRRMPTCQMLRSRAIAIGALTNRGVSIQIATGGPDDHQLFAARPKISVPDLHCLLTSLGTHHIGLAWMAGATAQPCRID